jgi:LuxR family maltose regulon positive regulatory protein
MLPRHSGKVAGRHVLWICWCRGRHREKQARKLIAMIARGLAKLTAPRTARAVPRERVHLLLERALDCGSVWIGAHAGSGKTTAIATFVAALGRPTLWYRVDASDLDIAGFFHTFAQLAPGGRRSVPLPRFGPEYAAQPAAFARRFFRAFFARTPASAVTVIDDIHHAATALVPEVVAAAIDELPNDQTLILLSREACSSALTARRAGGRLVTVDESTLRFDDVESAALLDTLLGEQADATQRVRLQRTANGWAAGLVLLAEHQAMGGSLDNNALLNRSRQALFDYFLSEIYSRLDADDRHFVQLTALLDDVTPEAAKEVTADLQAARRLDALYRRNLFITRQASRLATYRYHDLFREFLRARLEDEIDEDDLRAIRLRAAAAAERSGAIESAIALLLDAAAFERCAQLLIEHGRLLVQQGRRATLADAVRRLPAAVLAASPHIEYWLGTARMIDDAEGACRHFEAAYRGFRGAGSDSLAYLTIAQAVLAIQTSWQNHSGAAIWLERLATEAARRDALAPSDRLRVATAQIRATTMGEVYRVNDSEVAAQAEAALLLLEDREAALDVNDRALAADALQEYAMETAREDIFLRAVTAVAPYLADTMLTPWAKCHWLISFGIVSGRRFPYRRVGFPYANATEALREAWSLSRQHGLPSLGFAAVMNLINVARSEGRGEEAAALVDRLAEEHEPARPTQVAELNGHRAIQLSIEGNYAAALAASTIALRASERAMYPPAQMWSPRLSHTQILIALGDHQSATAMHAEHAGSYTGQFRRICDVVERANRLWEARGREEAGYTSQLRAMMAEIRDIGWANYLSVVPQIAAQLAADALEHGIERDFIVAAIRRRHMHPPADYAPAWPWTLHIRLLGAFDLLRDGVLVPLGVKPQKRPLELLKFVAVAPRQTVDARAAAAALWPEMSGPAGKKALEAAIHRLRKMLGADDLLQVQDGKLRLPSNRVWVDMAAFEAWLDKALRQLEGSVETRAAGDLAERLFRDYRGRLFGDDESTPWSIGPRERLHRKFLQLAGSIGRYYEVRRDWIAASAVYERGVAQDALAEELYRGLIRCHLARNEPAAALHAFRRCRETLSVVLGIGPAPATLALMSKVPGATR